MPRRGRNIYKRKDGRWEGRLQKPASLPGERKYRSFYGKTCQEVKEKMEAAKGEITYADRSRACAFNMDEAAHIWLSDKKAEWKESTYAAYRQIAEKYILPYFGKLSLHRIDRRAMEGFIVYIREKEGRRISNEYLCRICGIVQRVMFHMKRKTDVCFNVPDIPLTRGKRAKQMFPDDRSLAVLESFLVKDIENGTNAGILIALYTGIRIGELCALTWECIDLEANLIHVRGNLQRVKDYENGKNKTKLILQSPKTADSARDIPIPAILINYLELQKKQPAEPFLQGPKGGWLDPRTLQYRFKRILEKCDIPYFNFHMLRHAFATRCMEKGFDAKTLSEILGHSDSRITLGLYTHPTLRRKKKLMDMLDSYAESACEAVGIGSADF
ncbi:MAG: site-specific integrase [Clostridium sp.]|nr:site-specific integrase [Clostridium sp.]